MRRSVTSCLAYLSQPCNLRTVCNTSLSSLFALWGGALAFRVYNVPLNSTLKYEEITFRQKLDSWKTRPVYPFHSASSGRLLKSSLTNSTLPNGLIEAVHLACTNHHGLKLSPDAIFFAILEGLAFKIKSDPLLDDLFEYGGSDYIVDSWFGGFKDGDEWEEMIIGLQGYEKENVNPDLYSDFEAHFSTSTELTSSFFPLMLKSRVNIASLNRKWVSALPASQARCELPEVRLDGNPGDWKQIRQRTDSILTRLGIDDWKRNLIPVLDQFVSASEGSP
ncbi:hypothetical protein DSO57_1008970 [Entomophthora muscae]|uniref:Uncharacterized protein n=1 Tax=Entomophthora muscae TaxID=34485 RepID=A0ACC2SW16_9FUNG|nr:hypothetical protein DSO57_1008970 [Entomophthora muscae]